MKITEIHPRIVFGGWRNWVFVEVQTDEGITGCGEATLEGKEKAVVGAVEDFSRHLIDKDPRRVEVHWATMYRDSYWRKGPVLSTALGSLDIAMWDILAQSLGVPICGLFGGPFRTEVPAYANGWYFGAVSVDDYAERAHATAQKGFRALKWDPFRFADTVISREDERFATDCVGAVRDAVGPEVKLLIEAHGRFNPETALNLIRKLEPFDLTWFEEPVPPDLLTGLAEVARRSPIPIAAGERFYTRYDFLEPLRQGMMQFVQPDVLHVGGLSEARRIAALAEAYGRSVYPHNAAGPVGTAATLQLAASIPNFGMLEYFDHDAPWRDEVCLPAIEVKNGVAQIPSTPGLGLSLNHAVADAHPYRPMDLQFFSAESTLTRSPLEAS